MKRKFPSSCKENVYIHAVHRWESGNLNLKDIARIFPANVSQAQLNEKVISNTAIISLFLNY